MVLTLELPDTLSQELEKRAMQAGATMSEYVISELQRLQPVGAGEPGVDTHPLIDFAIRIRTGMQPDEALALPEDFARNHDHYIHGAARKSE